MCFGQSGSSRQSRPLERLAATARGAISPVAVQLTTPAMGAQGSARGAVQDTPNLPTAQSQQGTTRRAQINPGQSRGSRDLEAVDLEAGISTDDPTEYFATPLRAPPSPAESQQSKRIRTVLEVRVISASGLPSTWGDKAPDPFAVVTITPARAGKKRRRLVQHTDTVKATKDPEWTHPESAGYGVMRFENVRSAYASVEVSSSEV